jgi:hypothetical protein
MKKAKIFLLFIFFSLPVFAHAQNLNSQASFNVDPSYDISGRSRVDAFLQQVGQNAYFYVENDYYKNLNASGKTQLSDAINSLSAEFDSAIYPKLRAFYGSEWKPGIDQENKITVLFFNMKNDAAGYFNSGDEYPKIQSPNSNEKEMVYLGINQATSSLEKGFLAHEFTHLITFNQKDKINGVSEETWLNEARAEYAPSFLGYNDVYEGSILQQRVKSLLDNPSDSLTAWQNKKSDYGVVDLFTLFLVDHYGKNVLSDSLKSNLIGISSINAALKLNGFSDDFNFIFTNWTIAALVNDCSFADNYCYFNQNLKSFRVVPDINFLPLSGESTLLVNNATYDWSGNWHKIIGGRKGALTLEFNGDSAVSFRIPYLACNKSEKCQIQSMVLDNFQKGKIVLPDFSLNYSSLTFIPSVQSKFSGFDNFAPTYVFSWKVSVSENPQGQTDTQTNNLLAQIDALKKQIALLQAQMTNAIGNSGQNLTCGKLQNNLSLGMTNNQEVKCLQQFLKDQGLAIYPEGLVTGNFYSKTQQAVIRLQEKYADVILKPLGLSKGTGYVGLATRQFINKLEGF